MVTASLLLWLVSVWRAQLRTWTGRTWCDTISESALAALVGTAAAVAVWRVNGW